MLTVLTKRNYIMKRSYLILATLICSLNLFAQGYKLPSYYSQRELKAPVAVKEELELMRREIAAKNLKYQVGYTSVSEVPLEKFSSLKVPAPDRDGKIRSEIQADVTKSAKLSVSQDKLSKEAVSPYVYGEPFLWELDLRKAGLVTPVRDQKEAYGASWAFATMAAYESSYKIITKKEINTSEQFVLDCSGAGTWESGDPYSIFLWMTKNRRKVADESSVPYTGSPMKCNGASPATDYYATEVGGVTAQYYSIPTVIEIKDAICRHGAIVAGVNVTDSFKNYVEGIFIGHKSNTKIFGCNHLVTIIGWDNWKACWLIKNSWGTDWGSECGYGSERGYMWLDYDSNNIGYTATWVQASQTGLK